MNQIIQEITSQIKDKRIIVAVSGGPDSMVLLNLVLKALPKEQIIICHVNHKVRTESDEEEKYLVDIAKKENIKIYVKSLEPIKNNFEEEARKKRYEFFLTTAKKEDATYLLTGHNADDNLETIIMRLIKKSSLQAYAGIKKISNNHGLILYRPLINVSKKSIEAYAIKSNIKYFIDKTNYSLENERSRIRNQITPLLLKENPNLYEAISYFSESITNVSEILEKNKKNFIINHIFTNNNDICINIEDFKKENKYFQKEVLFDILKPYNLSINNIEDIIKQIYSKQNNIVKNVSKELSLIKEYQTIIFTTKSTEALSFYLKIDGVGEYKLPNNQKIVVEKNICYFTSQKKAICYNINCLELIIRTRKPEDKVTRFKKDKATGEKTYYTQTLSNYLTNKKIPYLIRKDILVLEHNGQIIAVLGYKI